MSLRKTVLSLQAKFNHLAQDPIMVKLARGGLAALFIKVGAAGLSFLMFLFLARAMSADDFGRFGFGFSLATLGAVAGSFGMRMLVLRFASIYDDQGQKELLNGVIKTGYAVVIAGCGALGVVIALIGAFWPGLEARGYLVAAGAFTLVLGLAEYQAHVLRAFGGMTQALMPRDILWRAGVIGLSLAASFGLMPLFTANSGVWITTGVLAGVVFGQALSHPSTRPRQLLGAKVETDLPRWRHAALGLWGTSFVQAAAPNLAVVIVGLLLSPEEAGEYFAAWRIAMLLTLVPMAISMVSTPILSKSWALGHKAQVRRVYLLSALTGGLVSAAGVLVFVVFGRWLIGLFTVSGDGAYIALIVLSAGYLVVAAAGPFQAYLEVVGRENSLLSIQVMALIAMMLALPCLSEYFRITGISIAMASNLILLSTFSTYLVINFIKSDN